MARLLVLGIAKLKIDIIFFAAKIFRIQNF